MSINPRPGAAEDIGDIATELRVQRWMLVSMLAFLLVGFGSVPAISTRILLPLGRLAATD